jgi:hypothetical protein
MGLVQLLLNNDGCQLAKRSLPNVIVEYANRNSIEEHCGPQLNLVQGARSHPTSAGFVALSE